MEVWLIHIVYIFYIYKTIREALKKLPIVVKLIGSEKQFVYSRSNSYFRKKTV